MEFFIPPPVYKDNLRLVTPITIRELCALAKVPCKASGVWTERLIEVARGEFLRILAEPGSWGKVRIEVPHRKGADVFAVALNVLAYGLHDLVARESIKGTYLSSVKPRPGRPKLGSQRTTRQRQRDFRKRRDGEK